MIARVLRVFGLARVKAGQVVVDGRDLDLLSSHLDQFDADLRGRRKSYSQSAGACIGRVRSAVQAINYKRGRA